MNNMIETGQKTGTRTSPKEILWMASSYRKRCFTSLVIWEMHIQTTVPSHTEEGSQKRKMNRTCVGVLLSHLLSKPGEP